MTIKEEQKIKVNFPISQYFQQLFSPDLYVKFINPFRFWRRYRINHLENCWAIDTVQYLECCRQIEWQPTIAQQDNEPIEKITEIAIYRGVLWENTPQNTILISQPSMKLKYRGVSYCTSNIVAINTNKIEIKPGSVTLDCSEKLSTSNINLSIPEEQVLEKDTIED
ncbi:MAG: hypothetical protein Tsb0014_17580 [Pleurocapsa sp.]